MKLIDKHITDIISGYDLILRAENELRNRWRHQLLVAYTRRNIVLEEASTISRKRQIWTLTIMLLGAGLTLVGIGITCRWFIYNDRNILWSCAGAPLLILLGLLILGAASFSHKHRRKSNNNRIPLHPLQSGYTQNCIFPDLRSAWMEGLSGDLSDEIPDYPDYLDNNEKDHGAQGERTYVQHLHKIFDDRYYLLARLMQRPREDVDVILIGPKGVWVFEVKRWSGEIYWDDHGWRRVQTYFERGGIEVTHQPEVSEPPDQQWLRAAAQVSRTLQSHASDILVRYPELEKVRGGIVFSKEEAILHIQPGRPVFWGTLNFWIKTLNEVELKTDLDTHSILQLVETLLARHQGFAPNEQMRSMQDYAQEVVKKADQKLDQWVQL